MKNVSMRETFGECLVELGKEYQNIVVLDDDLASSTKCNYFCEAFPDRFFEVGIAEQNMMGIAAGLATTGKIPFVVSFGTFNSKRACDQVAISVAYSNLNVKIVGAYSGLFSGKTGATHQSIEDLAIMRAIPNLTVVVPADAVELRQAMRAIVGYEGPTYLRVARDEYPILFGPEYAFKIGRSCILAEGKEATIISCGIMTGTALEAAQTLKTEGIPVRVLNMSTLKPLDVEGIRKCAIETGAIVTAENHSIIGGLGSAVAEVLVENEPVPMARVGIRDAFAESGPNRDLCLKYGLTSEAIVCEVEKVVARKRLFKFS
jgi:transketolase